MQRFLFPTVLVVILTSVLLLQSEQFGRPKILPGVAIWEKEKAFPGLNLYNSRHLQKAHLFDLSGREVHSWTGGPNHEQKGWHHIEPGPEGTLFAIEKDVELVKLDWNSKRVWAAEGGYHHDLDIANNGDIYTLMRHPGLFLYKGKSLPVIDEYIVILDSDGHEKERLSLFEALAHLVPTDKFEAAADFGRNTSISELNRDTPSEIFHANSIEIIRRDIPGFAEQGDLLIGCRIFGLIALLKRKTMEVAWKWGPYEVDSHQPTILPNDDMLIFLNGRDVQISSVIELDPKTRQVVWKYQSPNPHEFYTRDRGGAQRLPNGNVLITSSDSGKVFEVTRNGEVVWEFLNPEFKEKPGNKYKIGSIYRMRRLTADERHLLPVNLDG